MIINAGKINRRVQTNISFVRSYSLLFAPGRVNLIGEHTDYNGGHVFPCSLSIGTYAVVQKRHDRKIRMYSKNFSEAGVIESSLEQLTYKTEDDWANYPKGVMDTFKSTDMIFLLVLISCFSATFLTEQGFHRRHQLS